MPAHACPSACNTSCKLRARKLLYRFKMMEPLLDWVVQVFEAELAKDLPDIARLSIILGLVEQHHTSLKRDFPLPTEV